MDLRARITFVVSALGLSALSVAGLLRANAAAVAGQTHTVVIEAMAFTPAVLHIQRGDRIVFQNKDILPHTATAQHRGGFDSGLIKAGESWTFHPAADRGAIDYVCLFHPTMKGRIVLGQR
jgi:plastocyanin